MSSETPDDKAPLKRAAAIAAAQAEVHSGMVIGLGTGSTARFVIEELGRRVREEGLRLRGVPTSEETARLATEYGISLTELSEPVDVDLDGADEVDRYGTLTKGAGGAMTREKCVAVASKRLVIVVDSSKLVPRLRWPVPVEVLPFAEELVRRELLARFPDAELRLRRRDGAVFVTDNGDLILDLVFNGRRPAPAVLGRAIKAITGVVDHGLFVGMRPIVYVAGADGVRVLRPRLPVA